MAESFLFGTGGAMFPYGAPYPARPPGAGVEAFGDPLFPNGAPYPARTPNIDAGLEALRQLSPDEAAAIFTGGAPMGVPSEQAPPWGGVNFDGAIPNELAAAGVPLGSTQGNSGDPFRVPTSDPMLRSLILQGTDGYSGSGGPLLTATQMEQDARARAMIEARYPDAGTRDPMADSLDAASNMAKLEALLPVPTEGPAFATDEKGVIRNLPKPAVTRGQMSDYLRRLEIAKASHPPRESGYHLDSANKIIGSGLEQALQDIDEASDSDIMNAMQSLKLSASDPVSARDLLKQRLMDQATDKMRGFE